MANYTYTESNILGTLSAPITSTATTWTGVVKDRISGAQRDPQTTTVLWVIDKGSATSPNQNYEFVYGEPSSTGGVTTWTNGIRGLGFYGSSLTSVSANRKTHNANAEIGPVDMHLLFNLLTDQVNGTAEGAQTLTLHVFATEAARDASITSAVNGMVCLVTGTQTFYFRLNGKWYGSTCPVYATTTDRDTAIASPQNGMSCYVTADGVFYDYQGGAWATRANGATPTASTTTAGKVMIDIAHAGPTVPSLNSTRILDATSASATGQIKIGSETTGSRSATLSLHGDDTYTSGGDILQRSNTGANAATTWTHRGTGEVKMYMQENANFYLNTGSGVFKSDTDMSMKMTAGESLTNGDWVYVKQADGKVYKTSYSAVESASVFGVVMVGGAANADVYVQHSGIFTTSGLTPGARYYVGNLPGQLITSVVSNNLSIIPYQVGFALSSTKFCIRPQRRARKIMFEGNKAATSGDQTVTIGGAISFSIAFVEMSSSMSYGVYSHGWYDVDSGYQKFFGNYPLGSGAAISNTYNGSGSMTAIASISGNDLVLTWTASLSPSAVYYAGVVTELI